MICQKWDVEGFSSTTWFHRTEIHHLPWPFGTFTFENQSRSLENRRKNLWISFSYSRLGPVRPPVRRKDPSAFLCQASGYRVLSLKRSAASDAVQSPNEGPVSPAAKAGARMRDCRARCLPGSRSPSAFLRQASGFRVLTIMRGFHLRRTQCEPDVL